MAARCNGVEQHGAYWVDVSTLFAWDVSRLTMKLCELGGRYSKVISQRGVFLLHAKINWETNT